MKKILFLACLIAAPLCFCGCQQFTDTISNQTADPIHVKVTFADGGVDDQLEIWGTNSPASGTFVAFRKPLRIASLKAFDSNGKKIGDFSKAEIPRHSKEYGRNVSYVVFDDGIFPLANSIPLESSLVPEDQVKSIFKTESGQ